jgi:hypothetical protein
MIVILVHWLVKNGHSHEEKFEATWKNMTIQPNTGLYREILTSVELDSDPKFNTFSLTDKAYKTYINVGVWKDLQSFDEAVGKYILPPKAVPHPRKEGEEANAIYLEDFEFKMRERVILKKLFDRKGALEFPEADLT